MAEPFYEVHQAAGVRVIELALPATVDATEFDRLTETIGQAIVSQAGQRWVVDLLRVEYTGSAVLGLLVNVRHAVRQSSGRLVICGLPPRLYQVIHTTSLQRLFSIARSRPEAMDLLNHR